MNIFLPIEKQVCTPEQSRKLRELGVRQDSFFAWTDTGELMSAHKDPKVLQLMSMATDFSAAFNTAELGVLMPERPVDVDGVRVDLVKNSAGDVCFTVGSPGLIRTVVSETEAQARAALLIYLLENKLLGIDLLTKKEKHETTGAASAAEKD